VNLKKKTIKKQMILEMIKDQDQIQEDIMCKDKKDVEMQDVQAIQNQEYQYPIESYDVNFYEHKFERNTTQWIHEDQKDDDLTDQIKINQEKFDKLRSIVLPEQRSPAWFAMRNNKITASDAGTAVGINKYSATYEYILDKVLGRDFTGNINCYHGKKYEQIATNIYEYRMNIKIEEFGLLEHPKYSFLGASPDGICGKYKYDGVHLSKHVGRMLEIKCPLRRHIKTTGEIYDNICPSYYWAQVQLQLECCDLDECDFWQCKISEYYSRDEFIADTHSKEPFRSKTNFNEKGCLIQLIPKSKIDAEDYNQVIYDDATFIYPENIEMSPYDCDRWISETMNNLRYTHPKYIFDRVLYWRLDMSHNCTIMRDKKWFSDKLPEFERVWKYVEYFRENKTLLESFKKYIKSLSRVNKEEAMKMLVRLYHKDKETIEKIKIII
jgi:putative phage-type endonuclease